jgi:hypothetical protein
MTLEDARLIIKESNRQVHLEIEFEVAGKLLLISSSFFIKLN